MSAQKQVLSVALKLEARYMCYMPCTNNLQQQAAGNITPRIYKECGPELAVTGIWFAPQQIL